MILKLHDQRQKDDWLIDRKQNVSMFFHWIVVLYVAVWMHQFCKWQQVELYDTSCTVHDENLEVPTNRGVHLVSAVGAILFCPHGRPHLLCMLRYWSFVNHFCNLFVNGNQLQLWETAVVNASIKLCGKWRHVIVAGKLRSTWGKLRF